MTITKNQNGSALEVILEGRLDTASSPELEKALEGILSGIDDLTFDFKKVDYVSSSGLRVLMMAVRNMKLGGKARVIHANEVVKEVFEVTGFSEVLPIE